MEHPVLVPQKLLVCNLMSTTLEFIECSDMKVIVFLSKKPIFSFNQRNHITHNITYILIEIKVG